MNNEITTKQLLVLTSVPETVCMLGAIYIHVDSTSDLI